MSQADVTLKYQGQSWGHYSLLLKKKIENKYNQMTNDLQLPDETDSNELP